jgi:ferredoxin like protein
MNLDDCLSRVRYKVDTDRPHIRVDESACRTCDHRRCINVCPAGVYSWSNQRMSVRWERCLECGACRVVCEPEVLSWKYPCGGFGISYRMG